MRMILNFLVLALVLPAAAIAQKTVTAASVIQNINNHQPVNFNGVQVTGDLDFTRLDNMKLEQDNSSDKVYISTVNSSCQLC